MRANAAITVIAMGFLTSSALAQNVLFVRGADRSGGFLEASNDSQRTEQLSDIFNTSTRGGNHGWAELRLALEAAGFSVTQATESAENEAGPANGLPVPFDQIGLGQYDVIVLGSNNAVYLESQIDALEDWLRDGGGLLVISDANFGSDWADAPNSDQQFLDRVGLVMNQDSGTYVLRRSQGDFKRGDHLILAGVDAFDGEGVSPIVADNEGPVIVTARNSTRVNTPPFGNRNQGGLRSVTALDGALIAIEVDNGRLAGHFDRNTFFNQNGAGTNINRFDNMTYAINLFTWLSEAGDSDLLFADGFESAVVVR